MRFLRCSNCKTIYFEVSRTEAEQEIYEFNQFYDRLPAHQKRIYKRLNIEFYEFCSCGEIHETAEVVSPAFLSSGINILPMICPNDFKKIILI